MNLIKDLSNLKRLSVGEHDIDEVLDLVSDNPEDLCPDCGSRMIRETQPNWQEIFICKGCGLTMSN